MIKKILQHKYWWLALIIFFAGLIYLSSNIHTKLDLTSERRFSISPATKDLLNNLDEKVEVQILLTGNLSAGYKKLSIATEELVSNFRDISKGNLSYTIKKPGEGLPDTIKAMLYDSLAFIGAKPVNNELNREDGEKTERLIFPYAVVKYKGRMKVINLESGKGGQDEESSLNYSESLLEFKFDDAINKLSQKKLPVVAYTTGNGEPMNANVEDLVTTLSSNYRAALLDLKKGTLNADSINALLIVKPSIAFTEQDKIKIDQYVMQGGKIIWFVDRLWAEFDSLLRSKADFVAFDKNLDLDDIFFKYGVRINSNLVQDVNCASQPIVVGETGGQPRIKRVPIPYYPFLMTPSNHPISKNLDNVLSIFPSSIDTVKAVGIKKTVLLATDTSSRIISTPNIVGLQNLETENPEARQTFNKSHLPVAVLLEGKFNSLYANRLTPAAKDTAATYTGVPFINNGIKESKQIVVSDADVVTNIITQSQGSLPMGMLQFDNYQFANKEFLLNCLEYMVGNAAIIETRNKDYTLRLLDKNKVREDKSFWQGVNVAVPLLLVVILALVMQYLRRKKYAA